MCACQEDVFRVEDLFLISIADVSRAHFYAGLVRCGMSTFDCQTRTPKQNSQSCVGNYVRQCTGPWMQPNGEESFTLNSWRLDAFPEAWHHRVMFPQRLGDVHSGARR